MRQRQVVLAREGGTTMVRRAGFVWPVTGLVLLLAACGSGATDAGSSAGISSAPAGTDASSLAPVPTAQQSSALDAVGWELVGDGRLPDGLVPTDVAVSGSTVVTVAGATRSGPATLWSTDGGSWAPGTVNGAAGGWPQDVVAFPGGFVAVGDDGCPFGLPSALEGCMPAIWRSTNGSTWARLSIDAPINARLTAVTTWRDELIAVGARLADPDSMAQAPVILRSSDGSTWDVLPLPPGAVGILWDVTADGDRLVAVGTEPTDVAASSAAVAWISSDGHSWTREPIGNASTIPVMVSPAPGGFVATAQGMHVADGSEPMGWLRGTAWSPLPMPAGPPVYLMGVAAGPQGALIVGTDTVSDFGERVPVLYATQDGTDWGSVPPLGALPASGFIPYAVSWQEGRFYLSGMDFPSSGTDVGRVLAGMAYVPRPGEFPYDPPLPSEAPPPSPVTPSS
jgi:hypothetical protein